MKLDVVLTRHEFEGAVLSALNIYGKAEIDSLYLRLDGGIECTVRTIEEPVHSSRNPSVADAGINDPSLSTARMKLWTPDPPPFIRTVEAAPAPAEPRPYIGWYPKEVDTIGEKPVPCNCGAGFGVYKNEGWMESNRLHGVEKCELTVGAEVQVQERPWKELDADWWPPIEGVETSKLIAVSCACDKYGVYPEHGWVADGNLHTKEHCEGVEVEAEPPAISDAAALSASHTGEHGTVDDDDDIPF